MERWIRDFLVILILAAMALFFGEKALAQPFGIGSGQQPQGPQEKLLSSESGRYVFGQISSSSKDQFMLDTLTGRLWRISESGRIGVFLKAVPYCDEKGKCSPLPGEEANPEPTLQEKK